MTIEDTWIEDQMQLAGLVAQLRKARQEAGKSQAQIGLELGTSQGAVGAFERMKFESRLSTYLRYARIVGVKITFVVAPIEPEDCPS